MGNKTKQAKLSVIQEVVNKAKHCNQTQMLSVALRLRYKSLTPNNTTGYELVVNAVSAIDRESARLRKAGAPSHLQGLLMHWRAKAINEGTLWGISLVVSA